MKALQFSALLPQSQTLRLACLALAAPALVMTLSFAQAAPDASPATNWVGFTIGGAFVNGNEAAMAQRTRTNGDFYGGIDSLQVSQALSKTHTLTLEGHAMPGLEDYLGNLSLTNSDIGYVKVGYKQYRTFYDGSGGYMPQLAGLYREPAWGEELHVDRGEFSVEAGLRMENLPEITFNYKHSFRVGDKDSSSWGARPKLLAGATLAAGGSNVNYEFAPSFWHLDEKSDILALDVEHTLGNTDLALGLDYEHTSYTNSLNTRTGAVTVSPTTGLTTANSQVASSFKEEYAMDLFAGNIHSVTHFNDKLWLSAGFAYTSSNTNTDGSTQSITPVNPGAAIPFSTALTTTRVIPMGGGQSESCVGNLNLMWNPIPDLTVTPSVRIEQSSQNAIAQMRLTAVPTAGFTPTASTTVYTNQIYKGDLNTDSDTAALDLRYTGIADMVLYAKGEWERQDQTNYNSGVFYQSIAYNGTVTGGPNSDFFREGITVNQQDYTVGANWYPLRSLSFALQGRYCQRNDESNPSVIKGTVAALGLAPEMIGLDTTTDAANLRVTWHALNNLSLVTRYDYRETEYNNRGVRWSPSTSLPGTIQTPPPAVVTGPTSPADTGILPEVLSGRVMSNILSESVTWMPMERLYLQASASYTWAQTSTNTQMVPDSRNDYFTGSLSLGYAIDNRTDLTASYTYYVTKNYTQQGSPYTAGVSGNSVSPIPYAMGYGLNTQENSVSLTLNRMITPTMVWNLRYALISSQTTGALQDQSGGFNDYTAQMISTGLQIRF